MKKQILAMFAFMFVLIPAAIFAGCNGNTPEPEPVKYNVSFELKNAPNNSIRMVENNSGSYIEGATATVKIEFLNGYRPEGLVATANNTAITGVLSDENDNAYSASTPLGDAIYWSYEVSNIRANTDVKIDVAECQRGTIAYHFDESFIDRLHYVVLDEEPTDYIVTEADLRDFLNNKEIKHVTSETIYIPYNSYVLLLSADPIFLLYLQDEANPDADNGHLILTACQDTATLDFFSYEYSYKEATQHCQLFSFVAKNEKLNSVISTYTDLSSTQNTIANTFAFCSIGDGTTVQQLATGANLPDEYKAIDEEEHYYTCQIEQGGENYYRLKNTGLMYTYIGTEDLTQELQKNYSDIYHLHLDDYIAFEINGFGSFDPDDHYYLSTTINTDEGVKVDISNYIIKRTDLGRPTYYFRMTKEELNTILTAHPEFTVTIKDNIYGLGYIVYEKNQTMLDVTKITLQGYDYEKYSPNMQLFGFDYDTSTDTASNYQYGYLCYADYRTKTDSMTTPTYYLNKSSLVENGPEIVQVYIATPTCYYSNKVIHMYSQVNYEIYNQTGTKLYENNYQYTSDDLATMDSVYCPIPLPSFYSTSHYRIKISLVEKEFDATEHLIQNKTDRQIYYFTCDYDSPMSIPTEATGWRNLSTTNLNMTFTDKKLMYLLAELHDTEDTTETLGFGFETPKSDPSEETTYSILNEFVAYKDILGRNMTVTIEDKTYQVYATYLTPFYYNANMNLCITIQQKAVEEPTE